MAEIVCPHCHASVPPDGAFCPRCRSFIGSATDEEHQPTVVVAATVAGGSDAAAVAESTGRAGAARAAVAKDLFEEAVRSSMAQSRTRPDDRVESVARDDEPDPYPSDSELSGESSGESSGPDRPSRPRRRPVRRPPATRDGQGPSVLARAIVWLVGLPRKVRTMARRLGPMPVTLGVVVLALLGSGGLLYSVGAFDRGAAARQQSGHAQSARALAPATYTASCTSPPSVDAAGNRVTFGAGHLVDGQTATAWRCPGDGSGQRVTFTFSKPVQVTQVALVPGWATRDHRSKANRFAENGAPTVVTWRIGSTAVRQRISRPRPRWAVQRLHAPATSRTVTLTIDEARKGNRRVTVAVSEIRIYGR